jgi:hypothetical protein
MEGERVLMRDAKKGRGATALDRVGDQNSAVKRLGTGHVGRGEAERSFEDTAANPRRMTAKRKQTPSELLLREAGDRR